MTVRRLPPTEETALNCVPRRENVFFSGTQRVGPAQRSAAQWRRARQRWDAHPIDPARSFL
jgi:hypothetical protein